MTVHCKDTAWKSRPVAANNLFPDNCKERLVVGRETVYEVDLDVAGVFAVSHENTTLSSVLYEYFNFSFPELN